MRAALIFALLLRLAGAQSPASVNCAGADLSRLKTYTYVSPDGIDSDSCGQSPVSACKTIQQGINNCKGDNCGVLVRYGVYGSGATTVRLADGISLYGSCSFDGSDRKYRSTVLGRPAISANGINQPTTIYGFVVYAESGGNPGEASVAVTVANSSGLRLSDDVLASGTGGTGEHGSAVAGNTGGSGKPPVDNAGGAGGAACPANPPPGSIGKGGYGADFQQLHSSWCFAFCKCVNNNYPASVGKNGENSGDVAGGIGGPRAGSGCFCDEGGRTAGNGPPGPLERQGPVTLAPAVLVRLALAAATAMTKGSVTKKNWALTGRRDKKENHS